MIVKAFSVKKKRGCYQLILYCFTPRGKERIVRLTFPSALMLEFISKIKKFVGTKTKEEIDYVG